jgi:alpha-ribazole phosphatase
VSRACTDLGPESEESDIIVVSHVSPIKAAVAWALDVGIEVSWRTFVAPASITTIGHGAQGPMLRSFNEGGHLV